RTREQRRLKKREASLARRDRGDMARSEHFAGLCDLAWRRRSGAATPAWAEREPIPPEDAPGVDRILRHPDELAPLWRDLPRRRRAHLHLAAHRREGQPLVVRSDRPSARNCSTGRW